MSGVTSADTFLPGKTTAVAPNGNVFYLAYIGMNKLRFTQLQPVTWTGYEKTGKVIGSFTFPTGTTTLPVINSFYLPSEGRVYIEIDSPNGKYTLRARLNKFNFDLTPLNNLPAKAQEDATAQTKSDEANYVHDLPNKSALERMMFSLFGFNWKQNALLFGVGGLVLYSGIKKMLK